MCKTLRYMGYTRQAMHHVAIQQSEVCRGRFMAEISMHDPSIWVDVMAATLSVGIIRGSYAPLRPSFDIYLFEVFAILLSQSCPWRASMMFVLQKGL